MNICTLRTNTEKMAKKRKIGRPLGPKRKPVNLYFLEDKIEKYKEIAKKERRTLSATFEIAMEKQHGI
jgi:hypothetical protein